MLKLGKLPATKDKRDLKYGAFRIPRKLPKRPRYFGNENVVKDWGMLGNDSVGDCVFAGAGHEHMLFCGVAGKHISFETEAIVAAYSTVTGYIPGEESTDQGTNVRDALKFRRDTGIKDSQGVLHKIGAFVRLEPGNTDHLFEALYLFDAVGIGIEFPSSAFDQFDAGKPWTTVRGATNEGGHYIPLVARRQRLFCVTWGKLQELTIGFYKKYCDEAWAFISEDDLSDGKSPEGFDMQALRDSLEAVGNEPPQ